MDEHVENGFYVNVYDLDGRVSIKKFGPDIQHLPGYDEGNTHVFQIGKGDYLTEFNKTRYRSFYDGFGCFKWANIDEYEDMGRVA